MLAGRAEAYGTLGPHTRRARLWLELLSTCAMRRQSSPLRTGRLALPPGSARRVRKRKAAQPPPNVRRARDAARQAPRSTRTPQPLRPICERRTGRPACANAQTTRSESRKTRQCWDRAARLRPASGRTHTKLRGAVHARRDPARAMAWTRRGLDPPPYLVSSSPF